MQDLQQGKLYILVAIAVSLWILYSLYIGKMYIPFSFSNFYVTNELNWGASPYIDFIKDDKSDDKYTWINVDKPNLDTLTPEYNFKTGVVDYRFGDEVYDSDSAVVSDNVMPVLNKTQLANAAKTVAVASNLPPPPAVTQVLVPVGQNPPAIVSSNQNVAMLPTGAATEQKVMLSIPAAAAASKTGDGSISPPVILPKTENFISHFPQHLTYNLKSRL